MMLLSFFLLSVFLASGVAQTVEDADATPNICSLFPPNDLVDMLLYGSVPVLTGPLPLPTIRWLHFNFVNGQGFGIESLVRSSNASSACVGDFIALDVSLTNSELLRATYNWTKDMCLLSGEVEVQVKNMTTKIVMTMAMDGEKPRVRFAELSHLEGIDIKMNGLGLLSPMVSHLTTKLVSTLKTQVVAYVESLLVDFMNKVVMPRLLNR